MHSITRSFSLFLSFFFLFFLLFTPPILTSFLRTFDLPSPFIHPLFLFFLLSFLSYSHIASHILSHILSHHTTAAKQHPHLFAETIEQMCIGQFVDVLTAPRSAMLCDVLSGRPIDTSTLTSFLFCTGLVCPLLFWSVLLSSLFLFCCIFKSLYNSVIFCYQPSPPICSLLFQSFYVSFAIMKKRVFLFSVLFKYQIPCRLIVLTITNLLLWFSSSREECGRDACDR